MSQVKMNVITKENMYKTIEEDIINLKKSFEVLHELVQDQQHGIDTIEDFIIVSKENTKSALVELKQAAEYQESNSYFSYYISGFIGMIVLFLIKK